MQRRSRILTRTSSAAFSFLMITAIFIAPGRAPAQDQDQIQCLARDECRALKEELRGFKRELRPLRREMRQLRQQIRETPAGEERDALIEQAREMHREIKQIRRERRPVSQEFRNGCRHECFPI